MVAQGEGADCLHISAMGVIIVVVDLRRRSSCVLWTISVSSFHANGACCSFGRHIVVC